MKVTTMQDYRKRMLRVLVFIQENLDGELSLAELAGVACFSPYHFHRIFQGMVGESLRAHVRRIRLERAALRLKTTSRPVVDIAFEAGYETHESFSRAFRSMTGLAPTEFRGKTKELSDGKSPSRVHYDPDGRPDDFEPIDWGGSKMEVKIENVKPMKVAFMRHTGPYDQCGKTWEALCMNLGPKGLLGPGTRFVGLCHDDPEVTPPEKIRYDACLVVGDDFEAEGDVGVQTIGGGEYAVTKHHGPYSEFKNTYAQLCGQWAPRNGREIRSAPSMEFYLNDPESTEPEELLTDIYMPLEPKGE
jgi:AraC family transcriptional regulator